MGKNFFKFGKLGKNIWIIIKIVFLYLWNIDKIILILVFFWNVSVKGRKFKFLNLFCGR